MEAKSAMHPLFNFYNIQLLNQALTHSSYANENPPEINNERLEFLGDALLNFLSGNYLYRCYPEMTEGEMTRRRANLVEEKQLAKFAIALGLDTRIRLGKGTRENGGARNPNLLSSTFEALVGAYYLDCDRNMEILRPIIEELFNSALPPDSLNYSYVDAKNLLQEWVQANFDSILPRYVTKRIGGLDHAPEYLAKVLVNSQVYGEGKAWGKKEAEKQAAENALASIRAIQKISP